MKNASIFLPTAQLETIAQCLQEVFTDCTLDWNGASPNTWTQVKISKKTGWFGKANLSISIRSYAQPAAFVPMMQGMMNRVAQIPAQNQKVQFKFMTKIQNTKSALGLVAASGFEHFEAGLYQICVRLDGYLFVDGIQWVGADQKVILDIQGQSGIEDLAIPEAHVQLGLADQADPTGLFPSQIARKKRSILQLQERYIPTVAHLPCIVAEEEVQLRTKESIVQRTIAVAIAAARGEGLEDEIVQLLVEQFGASSFFSPEEQSFIQNQAPSEQDRAKFTWRYEDLWVFLWALGYVENLDFPNHICDVAKAVSFIQEAGSYAKLLEEAKLHSSTEILDAADLVYRLNWACVNARINNQLMPAGLDAGVVFERHYALNWLIGYQGLDWDAVRTDT